MLRRNALKCIFAVTHSGDEMSSRRWVIAGFAFVESQLV
jgi:hypothetical protein